MILSDFSIKLSRYFNKDAIYLTLIYVFLTDLVLGGAGTYLSYGSLSIRKVLFVILVLIMIYQVIKKRNIKDIVQDKTCQLMFLFLLSCILATVIGLFSNPIGLVINKLLAYSFMFIYPFFMINIKSKADAMNLFNYFNRLVIILSWVITGIFILLFLFQEVAYNLINPILVDLNFGSLAINNGIPRVFLKTAIYIPFTLNFEILDVLFQPKQLSITKVIKILVLGFSLFATMTMGFWATFVVCFLTSLIFFRNEIAQLFKSKKNYLYLAAFLIVSLITLSYLGIFDILAQRLNKHDFSFQVKQQQMKTMLELIKQHPIFGYGFGKVIEIRIPGYERSAANWEVMWLELIITNGIIGLICYLSPIIYNIKTIITNISGYSIASKQISISILASFVGLVVVNFSNPFLNNPIGLGYLVICFAIIKYLSKKKEEV